MTNTHSINIACHYPTVLGGVAYRVDTICCETYIAEGVRFKSHPKKKERRLTAHTGTITSIEEAGGKNVWRWPD
jgi:hypothetical protein